MTDKTYTQTEVEALIAAAKAEGVKEGLEQARDNARFMRHNSLMTKPYSIKTEGRE